MDKLGYEVGKKLAGQQNDELEIDSMPARKTMPGWRTCAAGKEGLMHASGCRWERLLLILMHERFQEVISSLLLKSCLNKAIASQNFWAVNTVPDFKNCWPSSFLHGANMLVSPTEMLKSWFWAHIQSAGCGKPHLDLRTSSEASCHRERNCYYLWISPPPTVKSWSPPSLFAFCKCSEQVFPAQNFSFIHCLKDLS